MQPTAVVPGCCTYLMVTLMQVLQLYSQTGVGTADMQMG